MTPLLKDWADRWSVPDHVVDDLRKTLLGVDARPGSVDLGISEAAVQSQARVIASQVGMRLWRNNVGVLPHPDTGTPIRFGLANDSPAVNKVLKSGDLIGVRPFRIEQHHVGGTVGQFVSFEVKHAGWRYTGTEREKAQESWAALVTSLGGLARFISDPTAVRSA